MPTDKPVFIVVMNSICWDLARRHQPHTHRASYKWKIPINFSVYRQNKNKNTVRNGAWADYLHVLGQKLPKMEAHSASLARILHLSAVYLNGKLDYYITLNGKCSKSLLQWFSIKNKVQLFIFLGDISFSFENGPLLENLAYVFSAIQMICVFLVFFENNWN